MNSGTAQKMIELSATGLEGLNHIQKRTAGGGGGETMDLFHDVVLAFSEMERALETENWTMSHRLDQARTQLLAGFSQLTDAYEHKDMDRVLELLEVCILPRYQEWNTVLRQELREHLH